MTHNEITESCRTVDPDALILPLRINLSLAYHFGMAKVREFLGQ